MLIYIIFMKKKRLGQSLLQHNTVFLWPAQKKKKKKDLISIDGVNNWGINILVTFKR